MIRIRQMFAGAMLVLLSVLVLVRTGEAQWQVPNHSVPIGKGAGTGFGSAAPGARGRVLISTGASTDPTFHAPAAIDGAAAFGFLCDNSTNNDAALALAKTFIEATGGIVQLPQGICLYDTAFTLSAAYGGGFAGQGGGHNQPTATAPIGTQLRYRGTTGNSFTISGGANAVLRDISFFPTKYRSATCEIALTNRTVAARLYNLSFAYAYRSICATDVVFADIVNPFSVTATGEADYYIGGVDGSGGALIDAVRIVNPYASQLTPLAPDETKISATWAISTSYALGYIVKANGYWWQATTAGTSAGSGTGPATPTWTNSTDPRTVTVADGTVVWTWVTKAEKAGILLDSGAFFVTVRGGYLPPAGEFAIKSANTLAGGPAPKHIIIDGLQADHNLNHTLNFTAGSVIKVTGSVLEVPLLGRNINIGASVGGEIEITGNPRIAFAATEDINVASGPINVHVSGNIIYGGSQASVGASCGVNFAGSKFSVVNNWIGPGLEVHGGYSYGICIAVGSDNFRVSDNILIGNTTGPINNAAGHSRTKVAYGNVPIAPDVLGAAQLNLYGATSGVSTITPQDGSNPAFTLPSTSGTFAASATAPINLNAGSGLLTLNANGITDAFLRQGAALTVIGRSANSTGNVADIACTAGAGGVLRESGSTLGCGTIATAGIADDAITYAKIQNVSATNRILGRITSGAGDIEELTAANVKTILGLATTTTDNAVVRADGTTGGTQNSGVIIDDSNNITGVGALTGSGNIITTGGYICASSSCTGSRLYVSGGHGNFSADPDFATGINFVLKSTAAIVSQWSMRVNDAGTGHFTFREDTNGFVALQLDFATGSIRMPAGVAATSATTGTGIITGGLGVSGAGWFGTYINTTTNTVNGLPSCAAGIKGARTFVSDNNTALAFAGVITTGGTIQTPVYCDGTVWRQGANDNIPSHLMRKLA